MAELNFNHIFEEICIGLPPCNHNQTKICIKNFIEKNLKGKDYWLNLIKDSVNNIPEKNDGSRKTLQETHRDLLIRWIVQLNEKNEDSYYDYRSVKLNSVVKNRQKNLANMDNCLFSKKAGIWIIEKLNGKKPEGTIHYEHNPPVKIISECIRKKQPEIIKKASRCFFKLGKTSNVDDSSIARVIIDQKYCVMIITDEQHSLINDKKRRNLRDSGTFEARIAAGSNGKLSLYRIKTEWIKKFQEDRNETLEA